MNRTELLAALDLVTELGIPDDKVSVESTLSSMSTRITAWTDRGACRDRIIAVLGEPITVKWFQGEPIASFERGDVKVEVWKWLSVGECPTCHARVTT